MDTIPPHPPELLLETSDPDQALDFDFDASDLLDPVPVSSSQSSVNVCVSNHQSILNSNCDFSIQSHVSSHSQQHSNDLFGNTNEDQFSNHETSLFPDSNNSLANALSMPVTSHQSGNHAAEQIPFRCGVCSQQFLDIRMFEKHMLSHGQGDLEGSEGQDHNYVCPQCNKTYKYKWDLNRHFERKHMGVHSNTSNVNIGEGSTGYNDEDGFDASQFINHFVCNACSRHFVDKVEFERHCVQSSRCSALLAEVSDGENEGCQSSDDEVSQTRTLQCKICGQCLDSRLLFRQHKLTHITLLTCPQPNCLQKFVKTESLKLHSIQCTSASNGTGNNNSPLNINTNNIMANLNSSSMGSNIMDGMSIEGFRGTPSNVDNGQMIHATDVLPSATSAQTSMRVLNSNQIINQTVSESVARLECQLCHSVFTHQSLLDRHCAVDCRLDLLSNHEHSSVAAQHQNRSEQQSSSPALSVTGSTSTGSPRAETQMSMPAVEIIPDTSLGSNSSLASNVQPTPDPCEICGKRFATLSNLKRHMMSHSKIRNFKCPYCHKSYIYKWDLTNHIKKAHKGMSIDEVKPLYSTRDFYSQNEHSDNKRRRNNSSRTSNASNTANDNTTSQPQAPMSAAANRKESKTSGNMQCKHCGGVFVGQNSLHAHMILRHSGVIEDANDITTELMHFVDHFTCSLCGKSFADKRLYRSHLATHSHPNSLGSVGENNSLDPSGVGTGSGSTSVEVYCNGCKAELMTEGIDLPSDEDVEYLCDVCDNERRRQEQAAGLAL